MIDYYLIIKNYLFCFTILERHTRTRENITVQFLYRGVQFLYSCLVWGICCFLIRKFFELVKLINTSLLNLIVIDCNFLLQYDDLSV